MATRSTTSRLWYRHRAKTLATVDPVSTSSFCCDKANAFQLDKFGVKANIFQTDLEGGNIKRLTAGPKIDARPAFSPDGSKLAFQSNRDGDYQIDVLKLN